MRTRSAAPAARWTLRRHLREKLDDRGSGARLIHTVRGVGYTLRSEE